MGIGAIPAYPGRHRGDREVGVARRDRIGVRVHVGTEASCVIGTSKSGGGGKFNNWTLTIWITLPVDYACAADCWWKVRYNYPGETTDTTTWSAYIDGNPLRLVE